MRLLPEHRMAIFKAHFYNQKTVTELANKYNVSRPTIYKILERGKKGDFSIHKSTNERYRCLKYGIKRLVKIENKLKQN